LSDAIIQARKRALDGDVVLFSPACASFDMYKNYIQRGEDFKKNVQLLTKDNVV